jgi:hypothetical protein
MNYLTNYYKNLSEQLQEKVNHLQKLLEANNHPIRYDDEGFPTTKPTKFSIVDQISGSMHGRGGGDESTYLVRGDDGYHYTIAPRSGKAKWAYDNEDIGKAPQTFELTHKHRDTFDIIDRIDNPKNLDHAPLIKRYNIEIPEEPDYDSDPPEAEDVHARIRLARSRNEPGTA